MDEGEDQPARELTRPTALRLLRGIYRDTDRAYATFSCAGSAACCHRALTVRPPWLWAVEWLAVEERLRGDCRPLPPAREDGACPFLDAQGRRCSIYEDRPFGCRTFFCDGARGPPRHPSAEMGRLSRALEDLSLRAAPDCEPRALGDWWRAASLR